jgi:SAM-dependent methyltransferase
MSDTTAGRATYMPGHSASQVRHHEWRTAENSAAYLIPVLEEMTKNHSPTASAPYPKLLDVGCGSGTITAAFAKYIPHGHITATDISGEILERAARYVKQKRLPSTLIEFQEASVYELPFADASFDVVHASMVLSHLDRPVQAYKEMLRVLRPHGVMANRESDLRMVSIYPSTPGLEKFQEVLLATMSASGGQVAAGPRLLSWALQAGARREQITAGFGTWSYTTPEEKAMWGGSMAERIREGGMRKKAMEMGLCTAGDLESMAKAWEDWAKAEDGCHGSMHGEILVRK